MLNSALSDNNNYFSVLVQVLEVPDQIRGHQPFGIMARNFADFDLWISLITGGLSLMLHSSCSIGGSSVPLRKLSALNFLYLLETWITAIKPKS